MFKIVLLNIFLLFPVIICASIDKTQAEASKSKLAALAEAHREFLSLAKSKQEAGTGSIPKSFNKLDLTGSAVDWSSLGTIAVPAKPATGGTEEVDPIKFAQSGYALNNKNHSPKDPVLVNQENRYVYGIIVQQKNASHYWVQFENSKVVLIHSKRIASKKEQQAS